MNLELEDLLNRYHMNEVAFFYMAHQHFFPGRYDVTQDVLRYQVGGIVPDYVSEFIKHLNGG